MTKIETYQEKQQRLDRMETALKKLEAEIKAATSPIEHAEWQKVRGQLVQSIADLKAELEKPFLPVEGTKMVILKHNPTEKK